MSEPKVQHSGMPKRAPVPGQGQLPDTRIGSWQTLSSSCVYDNRWISIYHQDVLTPKGDKGIYGLVHFKGSAVGVVPIDSELNTWLVKQSRYTLNETTWEIPEGGAAADELPWECALRELEEEVGLKANKLTELMRLHTSNSICDEVATVFVAEELSLGDQALESSEDIEVKKLPLRDAVAMAKSGEITDAISVAALFRLALDFNL